MYGGMNAMRKPPTLDKIHDRMSADLLINAVVSPDVVDDPLEHGAKLKVMRSLRDDPLAGMHSRKQIDDAQLAAGRLYQRYQEDSEIGGARAIDPTKEAVDGGRFKEPDITHMSIALAKLRDARRELGEFGASLMHDVLTRRMSISDVAKARCMGREREINFLSMRFRECLESLAKLWGFAG